MLGGVTASSIDRLLASDEPSIRWKVRVKVLREDPESPPVRRLREEIRRSPRVRRLIEGHAQLRRSTYAKWQGGHWVLLALAELGYPEGDPDLVPLRDGVLRTWLAERYFREYDPAVTAADRGRVGVPLINGRYRRCGSQHGAALLSAVRLGLADDRARALAERLQHWQWPDGGWNCHGKAEAQSSSVYETLLPMRGLAAYARAYQDPAAGAAANRAAAVLLERRLLFRRTNGRLIRRDWANLHYPVYWRYDVLAALRGLAEAGLLDDERCQQGLELLQSKELPAGGWALEGRYHRGVGDRQGQELVDWGEVDTGRMNEWVTADALTVLAAGPTSRPRGVQARQG